MPAKQRYISTSFWEDEWIETLDPMERYLYLYLITNPHTSISGIYKVTDRRMSFDTGLDQSQIELMMARFAEAGKAYRYGEWIILPSWPRHQRWDKRSKIHDGIVNELKAIPASVRAFAMSKNYDFPIPNDMVSIPHAYPPNYSDTDSDRDTDRDRENIIPAPSGAEPEKVAVSIKGVPKEYIDLSDTALEDAKLHSVDKPSRMSDELADQFETLFWAVNGQPAAIAKERSHCKKLATVCRARSPDDEASYAQSIVEKFYELRKRSRKSYWRCPFDAANLVSKFNAVADELERSRQEQQAAVEMEDVF